MQGYNMIEPLYLCQNIVLLALILVLVLNHIACVIIAISRSAINPELHSYI